MNMSYSKVGLSLTEQFEGCKLEAYLDQVGKPTIGYGHTVGVQMGDTCSQAQAEAWLAQDVEWAVQTVNLYVTIALTQGEFDALVDFTFNLGSGSFQHSQLLVLVDQRNFVAAAAEFEKWSHAGGVVVAGLLRRRLAEEAEFNSK
jgi:lysozyme